MVGDSWQRDSGMEAGDGLNFRIGDRVMVYPYWDSDVSFTGMVVGNSTSAWDENGGIYRIYLDTGRMFYCSEDAMILYTEVKEN